MWFALQTVTTVGYGDVTPKNPGGKVVAAAIMLEGIAFLAIVTAAITSTFVTRAARERFVAAEDAVANDESPLDARLDSLAQQLDRVESLIQGLAPPRDGRRSE